MKSTRVSCLIFCLALAGGWVVLQRTVVPLQERERAASAELAALESRIASARTAMKHIQGLEMAVAGARREIQRLDHEFPSSPPVVWVPDHIKEHFGRFGFAELHTQVKTVTEEPDLPEYQRLHWTVEIPLQDPARQMGGLLLAVADLDQTERAVRVADVAVEAGDRPSAPHLAVLTFSTLLRKETRVVPAADGAPRAGARLAVVRQSDASAMEVFSTHALTPSP